MKKPNVKNNKLNEKVELKMKKKFDMEKIRRFVLEKIYECLESDSVCILSNLTALAQFSDIEFTEEELLFCKDIAELMEMSNSVNFIKELLEAEDENITKVKFDEFNHNFPHPQNRILGALYYEKSRLERTILLTYMTHKFPFLVQTTKKALEWYLSEIEWEDVLSDIIESFVNEEAVGITEHMSYFLANNFDWIINKIPVFDNEYEAQVWYHYARYMDGSYLEEHYEDEVQDFVNGFIDEYRYGR